MTSHTTLALIAALFGAITPAAALAQDARAGRDAAQGEMSAPRAQVLIQTRTVITTPQGVEIVQRMSDELPGKAAVKPSIKRSIIGEPLSAIPLEVMHGCRERPADICKTLIN